MPEEFKNAAIFLDRPIYYMIILRFQKVPFSKCFLSIQRQKNNVFKFILFEEFFGKGLLSCWISLDSMSNLRNKTVFSTFSGVHWILPCFGQVFSYAVH